MIKVQQTQQLLCVFAKEVGAVVRVDLTSVTEQLLTVYP